MTKPSSASMPIYEGGCLCGWIRFSAKGEARNPHSCSCGQCRRHTGALTACWVEFPKNAVTWNGRGGRPSLYRSSDYSRRAFCPKCGSTLGAIDDKPIVAFMLGAFDSPGRKALAPVYHSFRAARPRWWKVEIRK